MNSSYKTHAERIKLGATCRKELPRRSHATWDPNLRKHDALALLEASVEGRVPELIDLKYRLMRVSPFGYFRGAVPVMAADLALLPHTGILNQICGDAHVRNLGAYAAPDGRLVFDINDFDETIHAPFEWDLKRLATSLILAGRESGSREEACRTAVEEFTSEYAKLIQCLSALPVLDVARFQVHRLGKVASVSAVLLKARRSTPRRSLSALTRPATASDVLIEGTELRKGLRIFKELPSALEGAPPMLRRCTPEEAHGVLGSLAEYRKTLLPERRHFLDQYRAVDVGFKIVGTGSVGLRDYVVYLEGNGPDDPLFLQVKEEARSGWAPYLSQDETTAVEPAHTAHYASAHEGKRVADGQRAMQFQSDPFLGWTAIEGRPYLVRQLNDHKASIEVDDLHGTGLLEYARLCGELLARGHARSGDAVALNGYIGKGRTLGAALASFAVSYADQTDRDWKALCASSYGQAPAPKKPSKSALKVAPKAALKTAEKKRR
jgi:uncharacterized protein (DUF2252 family)